MSRSTAVTGPVSRPGANPPTPDPTRLALIHQRVLQWYSQAGRDLPWRRPDATAWGVFVSEIMAQQTPLARVEPVWQQWMHRWPTPALLATDPPGEAVRLWGRLGYPRRALRLHQAATQMVERFDAAVPDDYDELLSLPGVGTYTAAAVYAFAFGGRAVVVDTNVRRVLTRLVLGVALPAPSLTRAETQLATDCLPAGTADSATWNVAAMELGALLCTARSAACHNCPVRELCAWQAAGAPPYTGPPRRAQPWAGTDRQIRGALMAVLRAAPGPVPALELAAVWPADPLRCSACLSALVSDGLLERLPDERYRLPGSA